MSATAGRDTHAHHLSFWRPFALILFAISFGVDIGAAQAETPARYPARRPTGDGDGDDDDGDDDDERKDGDDEDEEGGPRGGRGRAGFVAPPSACSLGTPPDHRVQIRGHLAANAPRTDKPEVSARRQAFAPKEAPRVFSSLPVAHRRQARPPGGSGKAAGPGTPAAVMPSLHAEPSPAAHSGAAGSSAVGGVRAHLPRQPPPSAIPAPQHFQQPQLLDATCVPPGKRGVELAAHFVSSPAASAEPFREARHAPQRASRLPKSTAATPLRTSFRGAACDDVQPQEAAPARSLRPQSWRSQEVAGYVMPSGKPSAGLEPQRVWTAKSSEADATETTPLTVMAERRNCGPKTIDLTPLKSTAVWNQSCDGQCLASPPAPPVTSSATAAANLISSWSRSTAASVDQPPAYPVQSPSAMALSTAEIGCKQLIDLASKNVASLSIKERGALPSYPAARQPPSHYTKRCPSPPLPTEGIAVPPLSPQGMRFRDDRHAVLRGACFDDERGDFHIVIGDHLCFRSEVIETLGKGSFGQVVKVFDHATGLFQAVKIIRNRKRYHNQALIEVKVLDCVNSWVRMLA
ncbi:MAG: hypothetical protein BJ554DRAFT_7783 [Olpidium bornovanus]|uniref:Protein kinase domain-containing protein n=1 Tax=Olpidium bornovanus TaxID=278681 RepID=A0A8H7ZVM4_9FUNG|nr:MAG: hypothetical protein BJ554DRAFT_7783 [Olpidium bornovanus]